MYFKNKFKVNVDISKFLKLTCVTKLETKFNCVYLVIFSISFRFYKRALVQPIV